MATESEFFNARDLRIFGDEYVKILVKEIKEAGKDSSGNLKRSVDYRLEEQAGELIIQLESADYLIYVDKGRKPGSYPNISAISKWASINGISQSAVFPIARSIYKFGIKPTNIISNTMKSLEKSTKINSEMEDALVNNLEERIFNNINKLK